MNPTRAALIALRGACPNSPCGHWWRTLLGGSRTGLLTDAVRTGYEVCADCGERRAEL